MGCARLMSMPESTGSADRVARRRGPPLNLVILAVVLVLAGVFGYREFRERTMFVHEEDARIRADMVMVASRAAGWVTRVAVLEGRAVDADAVLLEIDRRDAELAVKELEAQLEALSADRARLAAERALVRGQTESRLQSMRAELASAKVTVSSLEPQRALAKRELERSRRLFEKKMVSQSQRDLTDAQLQRVEREFHMAVANLQGAEARVREAEADRARMAVLAGQLAVLEKREAEIAARVRRQRLDLTDRSLRSPLKGVVDRLFVEAGEYVSPGQRLMLLHDPEQVWIEANIKETELRRIEIGQKVQVAVDAYPDESFQGKVERIGQSATSTFALLPSPNPSGNFTKITQRVPVRIALAQREARLRPGMMVEIKIATGR
ncbi:MAG: HlyD family secretion protein [Burkholderiales bacterium]|nr:HlyD family secretion protein [Burkholderiales bacterium]